MLCPQAHHENRWSDGLTVDSKGSSSIATAARVNTATGVWFRHLSWLCSRRVPLPMRLQHLYASHPRVAFMYGTGGWGLSFDLWRQCIVDDICVSLCHSLNLKLSVSPFCVCACLFGAARIVVLQSTIEPTLLSIRTSLLSLLSISLFLIMPLRLRPLQVGIGMSAGDQASLQALHPVDTEDKGKVKALRRSASKGSGAKSVFWDILRE